MSKHGHERDAYVYAGVKADPRHSHLENRVIDVEKENCEAREEEGKR